MLGAAGSGPLVGRAHGQPWPTMRPSYSAGAALCDGVVCVTFTPPAEDIEPADTDVGEDGLLEPNAGIGDPTSRVVAVAT